nr:Chain PA, LLKVAL Peptide [synthetic construct]7Q8K_PB Chain PB, LLKVAL Peptide [synthetic construct]7Q8P_PA Chain PA, LLKVAL Peptide [synthetic construct]
LLKVAL